MFHVTFPSHYQITTLQIHGICPQAPHQYIIAYRCVLTYKSFSWKPPPSVFPGLEIVTLKAVAAGNPHSPTCERRSWRPDIVLFGCRTLRLTNNIISVSTWSTHSGKSSVAVGLCWNLCWESTVVACHLVFIPMCCVSKQE
jgi:hypothetical protein